MSYIKNPAPLVGSGNRAGIRYAVRQPSTRDTLKTQETWKERVAICAGIIARLERENTELRDENEWLQVEVKELRATIAFEIEYEAARDERWSEHLQSKKGHDWGRPCR